MLYYYIIIYLRQGIVTLIRLFPDELVLFKSLNRVTFTRLKPTSIDHRNKTLICP